MMTDKEAIIIAWEKFLDSGRSFDFEKNAVLRLPYPVELQSTPNESVYVEQMVPIVKVTRRKRLIYDTYKMKYGLCFEYVGDLNNQFVVLRIEPVKTQ